MNERIDFERIVASHIAGEGVAPPDDPFYDELLARAERHGQRPRWLALIKEPPMRTSSHLAVGSPTARLGAILITMLLLAATVVGAGAAGQRLLAADEPPFPTGTYVATEWSDRFVEFRDDGTCLWTLTPGYQDFECTYAIDGDTFTETSRDENFIFSSGYGPHSYRWDYDGSVLTFQPDEDGSTGPIGAIYLEQPYRYVSEPRLVVFADFDIAAGTELLRGHTDLRVAPTAEVPADAFDDQQLTVGFITTADIAKGEPITPDLLATE